MRRNLPILKAIECNPFSLGGRYYRISFGLGAGTSRYHCEDVMASVFSELIPLLGVISIFIAICSLEGAS
jgi:hypothetical protein